MAFIFILFAIVSAFSAVTSNSDVRRPPKIDQGPPKEFVLNNKEGNPAVLPCVASGSPQPKEYEWFKDGKSLVFDAHITSSGDPSVGTITINDPLPSDQGNYSCSAKNSWGKALSDISRNYYAFISSIPSAATVTVTPYVGDSLKLTCTRPTKIVGHVTYSWGTSISPEDPNVISVTLDKRISISDEGDLYFANVLPNDQLSGRIYKCMVKNVELDNTLGGSYTKVQVQPRSPAPLNNAMIKYIKNTVIAFKGKSSSLRCIFSGNPTPATSWSRSDGTWDNSRYESSDFDTRLTIKNVIESDEGEYICTGKNDQSSAPNSINVQVKVIPEFQNLKDSPVDVNATETESVTIYCRTYAKPQANVKWYINGETFSTSQKRVLSSDQLSLTLTNLCRDNCGANTDLMVVSCNASNEYGYAYAAGYVNILKKTKLTASEPTADVVDLEPNGVNLTCQGESDPSTPVSISWYLNEDILASETEKYEISNEPGKSTLHIFGKAASGKYKCVITNNYSKVEKVTEVKSSNVEEQVDAASFPWWIFLIIIVGILFIVIFVLFCYHCIQRNKGDIYKVDDSERKNGNNPKQELLDSGFHDYQRKEDEGGATLKSARGSWGSRMTLSNEPFERGTGVEWNEDNNA